MIITQLIMVAIMTMTPIHIEHHGHSIGVTGVVIAAHVAGMFLPSPFSGWLVDRFGHLAIAVAAGVTLVAAGLLAAWAPVDSVATWCWPWCCSDSDGTWGWSAAQPWLPTLCRWLRVHVRRVLSILVSRLRVPGPG